MPPRMGVQPMTYLPGTSWMLCHWALRRQGHTARFIDVTQVLPYCNAQWCQTRPKKAGLFQRSRDQTLFRVKKIIIWGSRAPKKNNQDSKDSPFGRDPAQSCWRCSQFSFLDTSTWECIYYFIHFIFIATSLYILRFLTPMCDLW